MMSLPGRAVGASAGAGADDLGPYLRYARPPVREPFLDGVSLAVPAELGDAQTAALGLVDVTKAPFNADPTGEKDSTKAIQRAIDFARDHQMVCFFPSGTYRISDTLTCVQQLYRRTSGRILGDTRGPCMLRGSAAGPSRPRLLLAPNSPGFGDPDQPKYVLHFWARGYANPTTSHLGDGRGPEEEQANISMNQVLVSLDIVVGEGNRGAVAVRHQAAEGSAIEDCTIDVTHGLTGIEGGIGSGGSSAGVTILGGRVGLDFRTSQPTPVITGFTLVGQTESAIRYSGRQTLVAVGLKIVADKLAGPAIVASGGEGRLFLQGPNQPMQGHLSLVDSQIVFENQEKPGAKRMAIQSNRSLYLNNVFVRNADVVAAHPDTGTALPGNPSGWVRVREYARGSQFGGGGEIQYRYPLYFDGARRTNELVAVEKNVESPEDLQSKHLWPSDFPAGEKAGAANVKKAPYNARGDGRADDTAAIQQAIDEREIVFLPKGYYRLTRTLQLKPGTKLIGVAQHLSVLVATGPEGDFGNPDRPAPLVRTADDANASTVLGFCGLWAPSDLASVFALHWRSGGRSVFRSVDLLHNPVRWSVPGQGRRPPPSPRRPPTVVVSGHGGGNWYNFREGGEYAQAPDFRLLLIDGTREPLNFYQCSPQHASSDVAVEMRRASHVSIFGTKYEGSLPMLRVTDSKRFRLFGHGGNGKPVADGALFYFENCEDFLVANAVEGPTKIGSVSLSHRFGGTDPRRWHMIIERRGKAPEFKTLPLDRPVLYKRGNPDAGTKD